MVHFPWRLAPGWHWSVTSPLTDAIHFLLLCPYISVLILSSPYQFCFLKAINYHGKDCAGSWKAFTPSSPGHLEEKGSLKMKTNCLGRRQKSEPYFSIPCLHSKWDLLPRPHLSLPWTVSIHWPVLSTLQLCPVPGQVVPLLKTQDHSLNCN